MKSGVILVGTLLSLSFVNCASSSQGINEGKNIFYTILSRYERLNTCYREPYVAGGGTSDPVCCIIVPTRDWNSLSESRKQALSIYTESLINKVKANPIKYSGVRPVAPFVADNILKMRSNSWCIITGQITPDGKDISIDDTVMSGR